MRPFKIADLDETQAPLLDHLIELRARLMRSLLALALASMGCYAFAHQLLAFLVRPLAAAFPPGQGRLIYTKLYEAFFVEIKVAVFAGFLLSFPIIANQLWAFIAPGLYAREKRAFLPFLIATPVLFTCGAAFAYYVVMPNAFRFLLGFSGETGGLRLEAMPSTGDYLTFVMQFIFAFGACFLLPVFMMLLDRAGLVSRRQMAAARRYVIVGIVIVAVLLTPPDVASALMLAVPMWMLFEGSLMMMWLGERRAAKAEAKAAAAP
ncbi:MAG: twin-arginine translocase subunit TatC [Sphingomonadales bacterium]|nr:twin-arginine translocase subunit TatC [Sphingomonadales bacterium]